MPTGLPGGRRCRTRAIAGSVPALLCEGSQLSSVRTPGIRCPGRQGGAVLRRAGFLRGPAHSREASGAGRPSRGWTRGPPCTAVGTRVSVLPGRPAPGGPPRSFRLHRGCSRGGKGPAPLVLNGASHHDHRQAAFSLRLAHFEAFHTIAFKSLVTP
jgi:hypothetical protein